jgi:adenosine deaminase CECR1
VANDMTRIKTLRQAYPHFILGYDLDSEEDLGHSLLYHLDTFLPLENSLQSGDFQLPLYFHAGETSWIDDLVSTSDPSDLVATIENLLDVVLLNSKRIGHGIALVKYPYLLSVVKERGIAIEVCPVSNQILGYVPDLRNHPAVNFLRSGNAVVLGADDPGTFGYDNFSVDWYQAYMAWGLDLADLKTLAYNSLMYSGLTSDEKTDAVNKWKLQWDHFAATVKAEACSTNFTADNTNVTFGKIFPRQVTDHQPINITVYGRNFHTAICQKVVCKFNDAISVYARYITNFKLICQFSPRVSNDINVTVHVSLDGGQTYSVAGNITYVTSQRDNNTYVTSQRVNNAAVNQNNVTLVLWFAVLFNILLLLKR